MDAKVIIVCQIIATYTGNDFRSGQPTYRIDAPHHCYSESDVLPEEVLRDDANALALDTKIRNMIRKMEKP